ncbi:MAG: DNA primase, partial [Clostridiales bacterium]|nr:DNA primase [Clostridiales bacterium]
FHFLDELLYPEDIPTLQEFMGYALIPTNKGQKMMVVVGNGGEGKSRIGRVLRALLGDNMSTFSLQKLACDRFARADLEGQLLLLDDDMNLEALP